MWRRGSCFFGSVCVKDCVSGDFRDGAPVLVYVENHNANVLYERSTLLLFSFLPVSEHLHPN